MGKNLRPFKCPDSGLHGDRGHAHRSRSDNAANGDRMASPARRSPESRRARHVLLAELVGPPRHGRRERNRSQKTQGILPRRTGRRGTRKQRKRSSVNPPRSNQLGPRAITSRRFSPPSPNSSHERSFAGTSGQRSQSDRRKKRSTAAAENRVVRTRRPRGRKGRDHPTGGRIRPPSAKMDSYVKELGLKFSLMPSTNLHLTL